MKRIILCCLVYVMVTGLIGTAYGDEILFRGLPWGANIDEFKQSINAATWGAEDSEVTLVSWEEYKKDTDRLIVDLSGIGGLPTGWSYSEYHFEQESPIKVAGYNVLAVAGYFMYGTDGDTVLRDSHSSRLYLAEYLFNVLDANGTFDDLKSKLISLYGEGKTAYFEGSAYNSETWEQIKYPIEQFEIKGDNGTGLILEKATYNGETVYLLLSYGIERSGDEIKELERIVYQEKLDLERNNRTNNTDGL